MKPYYYKNKWNVILSQNFGLDKCPLFFMHECIESNIVSFIFLKTLVSAKYHAASWQPETSY